jgi:hypothetical protein
MPAQFSLPPDTRAVGTGNPPADMNAVVDAVTAMGGSFNVFNASFAGGAKGDGKTVTDAAITSGTTALTSATAAFTTADVGKIAGVAGAGAAGAYLNTTISAYVSATQVTLAVSAGTTVSAATAYYGTDDTAALQAAINTAATFGTVATGPPGTYLFSAAVTIPSKGGLTGTGTESYGVPLGNYTVGGLPLQGTILKATNTFANPNSATGLFLMNTASGQGGGQRLHGFSIDGSALPSNNLHGILVQNATACATFSNLNVYGSGSKAIGGDGFHAVSTGNGVPDLLNMKWCHFSGCAGWGVSLNGVADSYISFTEATGNGTGGWSITNGNNTRLTGCKGETSTGAGAPGWLFTAGSGFTGCLHLNACTSQSNDGSGFKFTGTGTGTYQLLACSSDDDGHNAGAGGGGFAGLECTSFSGFVLAPGFNVRLGSIPSPQYGISATAHNVLTLDSGVINGATAAFFEGGGNATIVLGSGVVQQNKSPGGVFGTGADGAVAFDGTATYAGFSTTTGSAPNLVYTLTRDVQATSIIISAGITVKTGNFRVFCQGSCTNNGTLSNAGNNASGSSGGGASSAALTGGRAGGGGGTGVSGPGGNGTAANFGTAGGNGGAGTSGAAGTGGTAANTGTIAQNNLLQVPWALIVNQVNYANTGYSVGFGAGGGGGGSDASSNAGGGGGGGGGVVAVFAGAFTNSATGTVTVAGGNGANGTAGNAGGGGGGAGGLIAIYTRTPWLQSGTLNVGGGTKGTHAGTGADGVNGGAGLSLNVVVA